MSLVLTLRFGEGVQIGDIAIIQVKRGGRSNQVKLLIDTEEGVGVKRLKNKKSQQS